MSDIQPTEADRSKARNSLAKTIVARLLGSLEANATYIASIETLLCAFEVDAVKAEREAQEPGTADGYILMIQRHIREMAAWKVRSAAILSDDQEACRQETVDRPEILQEYLDRQDGADIDLEHGSN